MMKFAIILAVVGVSVAFPQGFTPEVMAARNNFFNLYQAAAAQAALAPDDVPAGQQAQPAGKSATSQSAAPASTGFVGPLAATIPAGLPGAFATVPDAPDVAAAKLAFQQAFQSQVQLVSPAGPNAAPTGAAPAIGPKPAVVLLRLNGVPGATSPLGLPVPITNIPQTPEVNSAISHFTSAYNHALIARQQAQAAKKTITKKPTGTAKKAPIPGKWIGPLAATVPAGLPGSGNVMDTPEVTLAKAAFNQAYQSALIG